MQRSILRLSACLLLALPAAAPAAAQGADACANAQLVSGPGPHAFDNTNATTDGAPDPLCFSINASQIAFDVWFRWVAPNDGVFVLSTCGMTAVDTKIAIYEGMCGGPILACNNDACSTQTRIAFLAQAGTTYVLRVGSRPGAAGGPGTFTIEEQVPVLNPANGHFYLAVSANMSWTAADDMARGARWMGVPGHLATIADAAEDQFIYFTLAGGPLGNAWLGGFQDMTSPGYAEPAGGWTWVTGEPFTYQNWSNNEPNDGGGAEHWLGYWPADQWNDFRVSDGAIGALVIEYETGPVGTNYCSPALPNSSGQPAEISGTGSPFAGGALSLFARRLPVNQFGYFLAGRTTGALNPPGSQGILCLSGNIGRFNAQSQIRFSGPGGVFDLPVDTSAIPVNPTSPIQPGETWRFQAWFRDNNPTLTSNFTNGLEIAFQ